jgi:hypothetical protein
VFVVRVSLSSFYSFVKVRRREVDLQQGVISGQSTSLSVGGAKQPCTTLDLLCIRLSLQQRTEYSISGNRDEIVLVKVTYVVSCFILLLDGGGRNVSFGLYVLVVFVDRNMQSQWASLC